MIKRSGWIAIPTAFFLFLNFAVSSAKILFLSRVTFFLFLLILFFILRRFDLSRHFKLLTAGVSAVLFIHGIFQKYVLFPHMLSQLTVKENFYSQAVITRLKGGRIYSIFPLPTLYAIICTALIIFLFHYMLDAFKNKQKVWPLWGVLLLLGLFNLILTQSFGGVLYLMVGGMVYLLLSGILELKYLGPAIMVLALFFFITIGLRFSEVKELEPVKLRFSNWMQAGRIISDYPIWGVGLGNYENKISFYTNDWEAKSIYAHNFLLQFTAETGVLAPLILLLVLVAARKRIVPGKLREKSVFIAAAAALLCYNLIDIGFYFFAAGIVSAAVLSQIYPSENKGKVLTTVWSVFLVLSILLLVEGLSNGQRSKADLLHAQEQYEDVDSYYRSAIRINPYNYKAMMGLVSLTMTGTDVTVPPEMEQSLDRAMKLNPELSYAGYLKSRIEEHKKHHMTALYHAHTAARKNKLNRLYREWFALLQRNLENALNQASPWKALPPGEQDKIK